MPVEFGSDSQLQRTIHLLAAEGLRLGSHRTQRLLTRLSSNSQRISRVHRLLSNLMARGESIPSAADWLLDNYYVIHEVITQIRDHLTKSFYRELPVHLTSHHVGLPRIYPLAELILGTSEGPLTEATIRSVVQEYQQITALRIGELWAVPIMLRLAVIERLRTLVDDLHSTIQGRAQANDDVQLLRHGSSRELSQSPNDAYAIAVWEAIRDDSAPDERVTEWASQHIADPQAICHREFCQQAANQVSIADAVTTLRLLNMIDWKEFFESTSLVDTTLRTESSRVYLQQDYDTRDRCRQVIERLARRCQRPELDIAQAAVAVSRASSAGDLTYYLLGEGRVHFGEQLGEPCSWLERFRNWLLDRPSITFFALLTTFSFAVVLPAGATLWNLPWWSGLLSAFAISFVALDVGVSLMHFTIRNLFEPRKLPRLEYREGIPSNSATYVVVPTLIGLPEQSQGLLDRLERHYLSNPDPSLSFALLIDFTDAPKEHMPGDTACIETLQKGISSLNAIYSAKNRSLFHLFYRSRKFHSTEGCWMGWERKRGKLEEFNRVLRGATDTSYCLSSDAVANLPKVRYVLTLDLDTILPRDAAKQMIATLAHPLNRPQLSPDGRRVIAGYAILQPKVSFLYRAGFRSWFARFFAASAGVDPYSAASSDTYMDLFGRGSFTGKGLYDVDAFQTTVGHAFPDNAILSHDLIESNYARCALATDIEVFDDFPSKAPAYARRDHRWIRGDWQLLPWLGPRVPSPSGQLQNVLPLHERWKIFDNLRRSLLAPSSLLLLTLSWTVLPSPIWPWIVLALSPWLLPGFLLVLDTLLRLRSRAALQALPSKLRFEFANTFGQAALQIAFLVYWACLALDAIARTLYRLWFSKRRMLEWETAAATEARIGDGLRQYFHSMWLSLSVTCVIAGIALLISPGRIWAAIPLLLLWLTSPLLSWWVSQTRTVVERPLTAFEEAELHRIARLTWSFFDTYVGETDHWLPPDNFQEAPLGLVAHRTSPTNIGLYLLTVLAAHDLKYIPISQLIERVRRTLDSLDQLERHRGHFLNWYETTTLAALLPRYVSTVDSGNLLACLITLKQGLLEISRTHLDDAVELQVLAKRVDHIAASMHFQFLYNTQRELFSIGFNVDTDRLDPNHYDLLASESCITSFLAVARGEVPRKHWFTLGRLMTSSAGQVGLVSWGGTMFEYLMPRLMLPTAPGVLLDQAQRTAVARQIQYGRTTGRPWGISESGFALLDAAQVYQYQSFGVPGLGLKRGLQRDQVIAPYATLMAADLDVSAAVKNFAALKAVGGEGPFGFYEAIDFTPDRLVEKGKPVVVRSYMAHHQGMGFVAIVNRLMDGIMRKRFATEPTVRAAELLLDERVPIAASSIEVASPSSDRSQEPVAMNHPTRRRITTPFTPAPRTHLLSNGRFTTLVTNAGGGYSRWRDLDVTRWHPDVTTDAEGSFLYIRDRRSGEVWSAAFHPIGKKPDDYEVMYSIDKAEFRRVDGEIESLMEVIVVPDHDVEIRRVKIANHGSRARMIDLTSYSEIVLLPHMADAAHPAFGKLFLETEWLPECTAILARRRPRDAKQTPIYAIHSLVCEVPGTLTFETSREQFLGRRRQLNAPTALDRTVTVLGGTQGGVLDPILSLRRTLIIKPGEAAVVAFLTGVAATRDEAISLMDRYRSMAGVTHAFELAWAHARIELQGSHWKPEDIHLFQQLAGNLHYPTGPLRASSETLLANSKGVSALWAFGISGDIPIALLRMHGATGLTQLRQLLQAHTYWHAKGFAVDLVVLLENAGGYQDELHDEVLNQVRQAASNDRLNRPGGIFVRKGFQMTEPERTVLLATARVVLDDRNGTLATQSEAGTPPRLLPARRNLPAPATKFGELSLEKPLLCDNGFGGFDRDGRDYVINPNRVPPMPWSNVIANENAGFLVTDSGSGFSWVGNSQSNRLTPWSNDPVSDPAGEAIYLYDVEAETIWCPTALPILTTGPIRVRHGQGWTTFERLVGDVATELTVFVPVKDPVKISRLKVTNTSSKVKRLEITYYLEWVLGTTRESTHGHIVTRVDSETGALFAGNRFHPDIPNHIAFADISIRPRTVTADRTEFLGRNGKIALPASFGRVALLGTVGAGLDPCAAFRTSMTLAPGESRTVVFLAGQARDPAVARKIIQLYREDKASQTALIAVKQFWSETCEAIQVQTPDPAFDVLMNHWLLYQTLSCRVYGRSAFYQSGGAFGFRDQLQDVCALVHTRPEDARRHILKAASRQFLEGDVQHWWHEPAGNGVRTKFSDDFLWLPYVVAFYLKTTGNYGILDESVPYLQAPVLAADQHEVYGIPVISDQHGTLFDHCQRAIAHGWKLGSHGLPLMGTGDWNDGMNTVGSEGHGESVWVAWFQAFVLDEFAELAEFREDPATANVCRTRAAQLRDAVESHAWDGAWYRRAYFDDGTPLGSAVNDECQIDSLTQSWAVIAGGNPERAAQAMDSVRKRLIRATERLILLFDPPFSSGKLQPGYIGAYLPGVRENGGQYTHAALWGIKALAALGEGNAAYAAFAAINPVTMPVATYRGEPYAVAADVYSQPPHLGRAGWTWYTGSSAWMYRVGLEDILGFHREGTKLRFDPRLPAEWSSFNLQYRYGQTFYRIECQNPNHVQQGVTFVILDGKTINQGEIELIDDGVEHHVTIVLGQQPAQKSEQAFQ